MPSLENLTIESPSFDRIRKESGRSTEDGLRLLWLALNDTRSMVRRATKHQVQQIVNASTSTPVSTTSATYVTTGLEATITPLRSDSTIVVDVHQFIASGTTTNWSWALQRDGSTVFTIFTNQDNKPFYSFTFSETPGNGQFTYRTAMLRDSGANSITAQGSNQVSTITLTEISP